jgi:ferric-dicitrate binding protein FerR (iron transport regulator)
MAEDQSYSQKLREHTRKLEQLSHEEQVMEAYHSMEKTKEVNTAFARHIVWSRIDRGMTIRKSYDYFSRVAAVLVLPLLLVAVWGITRQKLAPQTEFVSQEITAPPGIRSQIILPDSTRVWLNSGSSIRYRTPFSNGSREVGLSGEAYFEVTHNPTDPFIVRTDVSMLEVLGTSFNVKAYAEEAEVDVALLEGKLRFKTQEEADKNQEVILSPGERAVYGEDGRITVSREPLEKYAAWRYGKLVFDETPMQEVAHRLERWFGVKVILTDSRLKTYRFTTTFDNQSLTQVLELLELSSPIRVRYEPAKFNSVTHTGESGTVYFNFRTKN